MADEDDDVVDSSTDDSDSSPVQPVAPINPVVAAYLKSKQDTSAAQQQASTNSTLSDMARAGAYLSAGLAHSNKAVDTSGIDAAAQNDNRPVTDLAVKQKLAAADAEESQAEDTSDPNSDASKRFRSTIKAGMPWLANAYGTDFDKITADDKDDIMNVGKVKAQMVESQAKLQSAQAARDQAAATRANAADAKKEAATSAQDDKDAKDMTDRMNKGWTSRSTNAAQVQNTINAADKVQALFDQFPDGNIPKTQTTELSTAVAGMIGNGHLSDSQIKHFVPSSATGSAMDIASWLTGSPQGENQQEFMKLLQESAKREKAVATQQKQTFQLAELPATAGFRKRNPDAWANTLKATTGIDASDVDDKFNYKSSKLSPADRAALIQSIKGGQPASASQAPINTPPVQNPTAPQGTNSVLAPQPQQNFAYGGMVGGLPASNFTQHEIEKIPKQVVTKMPQAKMPVSNSRLKFNKGGEVPDTTPAQTPEHTPWVPTYTVPHPEPSTWDKIETGINNAGKAIKKAVGADDDDPSYAKGGKVPGSPVVNQDSPINDTEHITASPGEVVLPLHVTKAKDPAMAAYIYMKNLNKGQ